MFTVIVPYFQEAPGILSRAIRSIDSQRGAHQVTVLVVDDGSPAPSAAEVPANRLANRVTIQVIRRPNAGPAAARNTGLSHVATETKYIAFLDSDDEWSPQHLTDAQIALGAGHDVFFANHLQLGQKTPAFERAGRLALENHPSIGSMPHLRSFRGDMLDQVIRGNVIGTSTVVVDWRRFPDIRFREEFFSAGEDYMCWMELAARGARFAFSTDVHAIYGGGVNVYSGAEWGTVRHLIRVQNELRYRKATLANFQLSPSQRAFVGACVKQLRVDFASDLLHCAKRRQIPLEVCAKQMIEDPASFGAVATVLGRKYRMRA